MPESANVSYMAADSNDRLYCGGRNNRKTRVTKKNQ